MIKLCTKCKHRQKCVSLCSKAKAWADQDQIGGKISFPQTLLLPHFDDILGNLPWSQTRVFCAEAAEVAGLSSLECEVLVLRYGGFGYVEIAQRLKVTRKRVDNALLRANSKLKRGLLTESIGKRTKLRKRGSADEPGQDN